MAGKLPSPADVSQMLFRCRRRWLPDVFPHGRVEGGVFLLGDAYGSPGSSLPIPFDKQEKLTDFAGDWSGDDLDLFGMGRGHEQDEGKAWRDACGYLGLSDEGSRNVHPERSRPPPRTEPEQDAAYLASLGVQETPGEGFYTDQGQEDQGRPNGHARWPYVALPKWGDETGRWTYGDKAGEPLIDVARFEVAGERKTYHQFVVGEGKWAGPGGAKLPAKRPLYRLSELLNTPGPVLLVGGEKCADAAAEIGYLATTNLGGENALKQTDWSPLKGRTVTLWPDNDRTGSDWLKAIQPILAELGCLLRIVAIPEDQGEGWDIADALAENGMPTAEVKALVDGAVEPAMPEPPVKPVVPFRWADKVGRTAPKQTYIVEQWIPRGVVTGLFGTGGLGKTLLAQLLASCCATGSGFLQLSTHPCKVLGLFCEDDEVELWRRQERVNAYLGVPMESVDENFLPVDRLGEVNVLLRSGKAEGDTEDGPMWQLLLEALATIKPELLIIDNIVQVFSGNLNDPIKVSRFVGMLSKLCRKFGLSVLLLGHTAKAEGSEFLGAQQWSDALRSRLLLRRVKPDTANRIPEDQWPIMFSRPKSNRAEGYEADIEVVWRDGVLCRKTPVVQGSFANKLDRAARKAMARTCVLKALDILVAQGRWCSESKASRYNYLPHMMGAASLADDFNINELHAAIEEMLQSGKIRRDVVGQYANRTPRYGLVRS
jgi:RecA-family ATPase